MPLPEHLANNDSVNASNRQDGVPEIGDHFFDAESIYKWQEWNTASAEEVKNPLQAKIDLSKSEQIWFYMGKTSTEARAQFTEDLANQRHNPKGNFLDTVKPPPRPVVPAERRSYPASYPSGANIHALNGAMAAQRQQMSNHNQTAYNKPYQYKPKPDSYMYTPRTGGPTSSGTSQPQYRPAHSPHTPGMPIGQTSYSHSFAEHVRRNSKDLSTGGYPYQSQTYSQVQRAGIKDPRLAQSPRAQPSSSPPQRTSPLYPNSFPPSISHQQPKLGQDSKPSTASINSTTPPGSPFGLVPMPSLAEIAKNPSLMSNGQYLQHIKQYPYLRNSHLRKPKKYQSPYAAKSGFTDAYMPIPPINQVKKAPASSAPSASSSYNYTTYAASQSYGQRPGYPNSVPPKQPFPQPNAYPPSRTTSGSGATYLYQTSQQFQQQMARDAAQLQTTRFDKMMTQLRASNIANGAGASLVRKDSIGSNHSGSTIAVQTTAQALGDTKYRPQSDSAAKAVAGANPMSPKGRTTTPVDASGGATPVRPEYSPISDPGSAGRSYPQPSPRPGASQPQGLGIHTGGGETWRYLPGGAGPNGGSTVE